jgi:hypothetical protein
VSGTAGHGGCTPDRACVRLCARLRLVVGTAGCRCERYGCGQVRPTVGSSPFSGAASWYSFPVARITTNSCVRPSLSKCSVGVISAVKPSGASGTAASGDSGDQVSETTSDCAAYHRRLLANSMATRNNRPLLSAVTAVSPNLSTAGQEPSRAPTSWGRCSGADSCTTPLQRRLT